MIYLVEHDGYWKPLDKIAEAVFRQACDPVILLIEDRLGNSGEYKDLIVFFSVDPEVGLQIRLEGEPILVNSALDRTGLNADISKFDA